MVNWHLWEPFGAPLWRCRCISKWWMIHGDVCVHPTFQNIHPNSSFKSEPNMYWAAALPATRPKTTQSKSELPPKRLLPCTPPATCQGENLWKSAWNLWGWSQVAWGSCFLFFFWGWRAKDAKKHLIFEERASRMFLPGKAMICPGTSGAMKENPAKNSAASVAYKRTHVILPFAYWEGWQFNPNFNTINCNSLLQLSFWIFCFQIQSRRFRRES